MGKKIKTSLKDLSDNSIDAYSSGDVFSDDGNGSNSDSVSQQASDSSDSAAKHAKKAPKKKKSSSKKQTSTIKKKAISKKKNNSSNSKSKNKSQQQSKKNKNNDDLDEKQLMKQNFLPGQKYQTPNEDDGSRAFYVSLYQQNPKSQMAEKWCLQYGLLDIETAKKVQKKIDKSKNK